MRPNNAAVVVKKIEDHYLSILRKLFLLSFAFLMLGCAERGGVSAFPTSLPEVSHEKSHTKEPLIVHADKSAETTSIKTVYLPKMSQKMVEKGDDSFILPEGDKIITADGMPLIQFIHLALHDVLGLSYDADPKVRARMDKVSMSIASPVPAAAMFSMVEETLLMYGVSLLKNGKIIKVIPTSELSKAVPTVITDSMRASIAAGRVMEFVPLRYVSATELTQLSQYMFTSGDVGNSIVSLTRFHAVVIVGEPSRIAQLRKAIALIDRPAFLGKKILFIKPVYWNVLPLKVAIEKALKAEGVPVSRNERDRRGVQVITIKENNSMIIASPEDQWLSRAKIWLAALDKPSDKIKSNSHIYYVKNAKASDMAEVARNVMTAKAKTVQLSVGKKGQVPEIILSAKQNALIFVGQDMQYKSFLKLMQDLDRPRKSVVIEVTVAEVTLNNDLQFGVEWQTQNVGGNKAFRRGYSDTLSTLGGLALGGGGMAYSLISQAGLVRAKLNALAQAGKVKLLSNPTLLALDGETSRLQVGTQLPIVSQEVAPASGVGAAATTGVVRTFVMVDTGVILELTPEIHEGDMVQLKLHQEVSEAGQSATNTPPILKRSIDTVLVAKSGQSVLIGGLISRNKSQSTSKVPLLGDIPFLGQLFSTTIETDRVTEMIVILTPHIIYEQDDLLWYTKAFKQQLHMELGQK